MENSANAFLSPRNISLLTTLKEHILLHLEKPLTIGQLARTASINEAKLKAHFKLLFGKTIHQFIVEERLAKAVTLLEETDQPIKQIAARVGCSERNFYALVRKYKGLTPIAIRHNKQA